MKRDLPCSDISDITGVTDGHASAENRGSRSAIDFEATWRFNPLLVRDGTPTGCAWGKWDDRRTERRTYTSPLLGQFYTIDILLSNTLVDCTKDGIAVCTRAGQFGAAQITPPGEQVRCRFERPLESVHLFIPSVTMREVVHRCRPSANEEFVLRDPAYRPDPLLGRFVGALAAAASVNGPMAPLFVESACQSVIAYLVRSQLQRDRAEVRPAGLQSWRLHKVTDFIQANSTTAMSLQAMADQAGLSRMHFAAQFLLATGMTPHRYLTESRLGIARRLLSEGTLSLAEIALETGFHSQAHFTTVFRKSTGLTPGRWRTQAMETDGLTT